MPLYKKLSRNNLSSGIQLFSANRFSSRKSGPDQIQLLVVDTDGTGKEAKIEVDKLKKGISKIPGVSNVQVTTSGRPNVGSGAFSGGEIFGILFGVVVALVIANFAYKVGSLRCSSHCKRLTWS